MNAVQSVWNEQWPEWPALKIQEWLTLDLTTVVYYHFLKVGKVRAIIILKRKYPGPGQTEERLWPEWPILEIQEFLGLELLTGVQYEPIGSADQPWYVAMSKAGEWGREERQAVEAMLR